MTDNATPRPPSGGRAGGRGRSARPVRISKLPWSTQFGALAALMAAAALLQILVDGPFARVGQAPAIALAVAIALAGCAAWLWGKELYLYLAGAKAATVVLTVTMIMTVIGTVIVQDATPEVFARRYGFFAAPMLAVGFDDIFHSYAFGLLLFLVALMSVVTLIRRRRTMLRWRHIGLLLTHISVVLIIVGGAIGGATGTKGMMHLEVGRTSDTFVPRAKAGVPSAGPQKIAFEVRLDAFRLDNYDVELKAYTYKKLPDGGYDLIAADAPEVGAAVGAPGPGAEISIVVKRLLRRARRTMEWVSAAAAHSHDRPGLAASLRVDEGDRSVMRRHLHPGATVARDPAGRFEVRLLADPPTEALLSTLARKGKGAELTITVAGETMAVRPGASYELPDGRLLRVDAFLPDFTWDNRARRAVSRSDKPRNPALVVTVSNPAAGQVTPQTAYLFAQEEMRQMMAQMKRGAQGIRFEHHPGARAVQRAVVVVARTAERLIVEQGRVVDRAPMKWGEAFNPLASGQVRVAVGPPIFDAVRHERWEDAPDGALNPALELEVQQGAHKHVVVLPAYGEAHPLRIAKDRILVYREKPNKVKNYESTISIIEGGRVVLTRLVKVNEPLAYGGWHFYQSNYDPDNPRYSGLELVHDPGLPLVELAFWLLMYGVLHTVALRGWTPPWERRRRREDKRDAGERGPVQAGTDAAAARSEVTP